MLGHSLCPAEAGQKLLGKLLLAFCDIFPAAPGCQPLSHHGGGVGHGPHQPHRRLELLRQPGKAFPRGNGDNKLALMAGFPDRFYHRFIHLGLHSQQQHVAFGAKGAIAFSPPHPEIPRKGLGRLGAASAASTSPGLQKPFFSIPATMARAMFPQPIIPVFTLKHPFCLIF